jgi:hypothetical protein
MFVLAGAAASVLDHLGSLHAASRLLQGAAAAHAAGAGSAFDLGSSISAQDSGATTAADGAGSWSSAGTMDALISMQGQAAANGPTASSARSINLLGRLIAQHAQLSTAASVGNSLSTFV